MPLWVQSELQVNASSPNGKSIKYLHDGDTKIDQCYFTVQLQRSKMYFSLSSFLLQPTVYFTARIQVHMQRRIAHTATLEGQDHVFCTEHHKL